MTLHNSDIKINPRIAALGELLAVLVEEGWIFRVDTWGLILFHPERNVTHTWPNLRIEIM